MIVTMACLPLDKQGGASIQGHKNISQVLKSVHHSQWCVNTQLMNKTPALTNNRPCLQDCYLQKLFCEAIELKKNTLLSIEKMAGINI